MIDSEQCDMEEFIAACTIRFCPQCGGRIQNLSGHVQVGRPRVFCSDACRKQFWQAHPRNDAWSCMEQIICPVCGHPFYARREKQRRRRYCSHACANHGRVMNRERKEET